MSTTKYDKVQKMTVALLAALLLIVSQCYSALASSVESVQVKAAPLERSIITHNGMVRVYLSSLGSPSSLDLTIKGNYSLSCNDEFLSDGTKVKVSFSKSNGNITLAYNGKTVNVGKKIVFRRHNSTGTNGLLIAQSKDNQNPYPGDLSLEAVYENGTYTLYPIIHVYIESYLYGVLPYEMGNSSPLEALKAQAVAARTYTVRMMQARSGNIYDVKDTTSDQVYRGTPTGNANCVAAVNATKGIVLMDGSTYITTFYSSSNGGQTEISRSGVQYTYMKLKDDPFDYQNSAATVKRKILYANLTHSSNPAQFISSLQTRAVQALRRMGYSATNENTQLKTLQDVVVHTPMYAYPSRLYTKVDFTFSVSTLNSDRQNVVCTLTETFDIFSELENMFGMSIQSSKNELWSVLEGEGAFTLEARRFGHGMGMSQHGAMQMAKLGYVYEDILGFYFDGCKRVQHNFTHTILNESTTDQIITVEPPADIENNTSVCLGKINNITGQTHTKILASANENAQTIGLIENGATVAVYTSNSAWSQIQYGDLIGYVPNSVLQIYGTPFNETMVSTTVLGLATVKANDYVNLRQSGSTNARIVGTAPKGATLSVFSKNGSWAKVQYKELVAYVNTNYINLTLGSDSEPPSSVEKRVVKTESGTGTVNLRKTPSEAGLILTRVKVGTVVDVLSDDGTWSQVSMPQGNGYMMSRFLYAIREEQDDNVSSDNTTRYAIVNTTQGSLNLRSGNSTNSPLIASIPKGTQIEIFTKGESWSYVRYGDHKGYVMTCYLAFDQTDGGTQDQIGIATVSTPGGGLNLRSQPNLNASILALIPSDASVRVLSRGEQWSWVEYKDMRGHVMSQYLYFIHENDEANNADAEDNTSDNLNMTAYVRTQAGSLNMRQQPSLQAMILRTIPQNAEVYVSEYGDEWCSIRYQGVNGYVMTRYLTFDRHNDTYIDEVPNRSENVISMWVVTESGSLNLRRSADINSTVLAQIPRLTELDVITVGEEWCLISYGVHEGYVMTRYLTVANPWLSMQTE